MHLSTDDLLNALREEGLRITAARRAICSVLADGHEEHLTAVELRARAVEQANQEIDQSTVYRTLDVFEKLGWLHHVHLGHGPGIVHFSDDADHHHLVCEKCGRSTDVPLEEVEDVFSGIAERFGFAPTSVHFALVGICRRCVESSTKSSPTV